MLQTTPARCEWHAPEVPPEPAFRGADVDHQRAGGVRDARFSGNLLHMNINWVGVCLDCDDAETMARFYGEVFGWVVTGRDTSESRLGGAGWICMSGPPAGPTVSFQAEKWYEPPVWPESDGSRTKMMHFEVRVDDLEGAVELVIRAGGRVAPVQPEDRDRSELRVMLDPAGHPFCLCA